MRAHPERNFYQQLKRNLERPGVHLQRVETTTSFGVPDVNYCIRGAEGWLELKAWEVTQRPRDSRFIVPKLRPDQVSWLVRRRRARGRAFLCCRINQDVLLFDGLVTPYFLHTDSPPTWGDVQTLHSAWLTPPVDWQRLEAVLVAPAATQKEFDEFLGLNYRPND